MVIWGAKISSNFKIDHLYNTRQFQDILMSMFVDIEKWDLSVKRVNFLKIKDIIHIQAYPEKKFRSRLNSTTAAVYGGHGYDHVYHIAPTCQECGGFILHEPECRYALIENIMES